MKCYGIEISLTCLAADAMQIGVGFETFNNACDSLVSAYQARYYILRTPTRTNIQFADYASILMADSRDPVPADRRVGQ